MQAKDENMICKNISVNSLGHLTFAGRDTVELAEKYGTPLYLTDGDRIRENCLVYLEAMREAFGEEAMPLYASKAASYKEIYRIMKTLGMGIDVVSSGEVYTASSAGFPMEHAYFHSNNKTDADIEYAMDKGIGFFVVDNIEELDAIARIAAARGMRQRVLLRLTPGIDPHTYAAVATGKVDSKFGSAIETGQAEELSVYAMGLESIKLCGFHCHVGSQVFDSDVFMRAAEIMLDFVCKMKNMHGFVTEILDLGGGYGVRYLESDPVIDIRENILEVGRFVRSHCETIGIDCPAIRMEPGRSIVADAGMTLYTVGTVKRIPGYKNYVSVDGGMADNPRFALYGSPYTVLMANKMNDAECFTATVAGRCCESGDIIQEGVTLPSSATRRDTLAVLTTGAYNYSMASNYNRLPKPPMVMLEGGCDRIVIKGESFEDVARYDI